MQLAAAVATYLAFRRDEVDAEPGELLALAARAEFDGDPPDDVRALLAERGVELWLAEEQCQRLDGSRPCGPAMRVVMARRRSRPALVTAFRAGPRRHAPGGAPRRRCRAGGRARA